MWLSKASLALVGFLTLTACGLTPIYSGGANEQVFNIQAPTDRMQFELVKALETQIVHSDTAASRLSYQLSTQNVSTVVSSAQELNRFRVKGRLNYQILNADGDVQSKGMVSAFTAYSATGSTLATDRSQRDAQDRLMVILADKLIQTITLGRFQ